MNDKNKQIVIVPENMIGQRLDKVLAQLFPEFSRSTIQTWIKRKLVLLDEEVPQQKDKVLGGEAIEVEIPAAQSLEHEAQDIALDIIYEDDAMLVLNKPAGLVVHPGAGNPDKTLLNGLLHHFPDNEALPRAGIVHRLDKDTSGLMVVAKVEAARLGLIEQLADHSLARVYMALTAGHIISGNTVDEPIARDKNDRRKMAINMMGKEAVTHYRVEQHYRNHTLLRVQLETGRTHQIRVHMNHINAPLVGDPVYGRRLAIPANCAPELEAQLRVFKRQALHSKVISYIHPLTGEQQSWECDLPKDMADLIKACQIDHERHQ